MVTPLSARDPPIRGITIARFLITITSTLCQGCRIVEQRRAYDCVVIGGGHNGMIAAAYLAKAGKSVCVLERRHLLGSHSGMGNPLAFRRRL